MKLLICPFWYFLIFQLLFSFVDWHSFKVCLIILSLFLIFFSCEYSLNILDNLYSFTLTDTFLLHFILVANFVQGVSDDLKESVLKRLLFGIDRFVWRNCFNSRSFLLFLHYILQFLCLNFALLDYHPEEYHK